MSQKYKNKYRIDSTRLKNWDYKWNAAYFITICTKDRKYYFGNVVNGKMQLNEIGKIAETEWLKSFEIRPDMNLLMGDYVIMPNHFHAIIIIGENQYNSRRNAPPHIADTNNPNSNNPNAHIADPHNPNSNIADPHNPNPRTDAMHCVSSGIFPDNPIDNPGNISADNPADNPNNIPNPPKNQFGPQSKNLASIIRGFKIGVTTRARTINANFAWQPRFHEHIIRDDISYRNISNYIINNPANWQKDKFA